jgi:hypothetical protein
MKTKKPPLFLVEALISNLKSYQIEYLNLKAILLPGLILENI